MLQIQGRMCRRSRSELEQIAASLCVLAFVFCGLPGIFPSSLPAFAGTHLIRRGSGHALLDNQQGEQVAPSSDGTITNQLSQYGITFFFQEETTYGQFANGDYWVVGPVTITQITPTFDGTYNGWEVNPIVEGPQGLDGRAGEFDATVIPAFPYTAQPNESIVKAISGDLGNSECRPCLQTAAVLTVLSEPPP